MQQFFPSIRSSVRIFANLWWLLILLMIIALAVDVFFNTLFNHQFELEREAETTFKLSSIRARLEENINTNLFVAYGMAAFIANSQEVSQQEFYGMAKTLLQQSTAVTNMAIAPDFVIKWVYPPKGNEKIIGLDYRKLPEQWEQAKKSKETGRMAIDGPINLVQGGKGLIARVPVFLEENHSFWGVVSIVINPDTLLKQSGVAKNQAPLNIAIRRNNGQGAERKIIAGDPELFANSSKSIKMTVKLADGSWELAAVPAEGWNTLNPFRLQIHYFSLLLFLVAVLALLNRSRHKLALQEREEIMQSMAAASHDALIMIDSQSSIMLWNPAAEQMFGFSEEEVMGTDMHNLICREEDKPSAEAGMRHFAHTGTGPVMGCVIEMTGVRKSGETFPVERSVAAFSHKGKWYAVGSLRDITARKEYERKLKELATTDPLTGLANRRHFLEQAELMLAQARRYKRQFCIMMFDFDHFKNINDTYGHDAGDQVLKKVAAVISRTMRQTDVVGRIGGEEFAVVLPETEIAFAQLAAERFRKALANEGLNIENTKITFTVSIGLTVKTSNESTLEALLKRADEALYKAKQQGRNRVQILS